MKMRDFLKVYRDSLVINAADESGEVHGFYMPYRNDGDWSDWEITAGSLETSALTYTFSGFEDVESIEFGEMGELVVWLADEIPEPPESPEAEGYFDQLVWEFREA
jgi:hypothetical protein